MSNGNTIKGVEIFSTGVHNGDRYDPADLDAMIDASKRSGVSAPIKLGHTNTPGQPAAGWVENLRRVGSKLVADFTHLSDEVYALIKRRAYDRVSCEVFWNAKFGGQLFRRALKAVALLGADIPAVTDLAPLHTLFASGAALHTHVYVLVGLGGFSMNDDNDTDTSDLETKIRLLSAEAGELLAQKASALRQRDPHTYRTYGDAFRAVIDNPENHSIKAAYVGLVPKPHGDRWPAADEVDRLTRAYMHDFPGTSYYHAMQTVLRDPANAQLARTYHQGE